MKITAIPTLEAVATLLTTAGVQHVYWLGETINNPPTQFAVLEPLGATPRQAWAQRRYAITLFQIRACAIGLGDCHTLVQTIVDALPANEYHVQQSGYMQNTDGHYEIPITVRTIT